MRLHGVDVSTTAEGDRGLIVGQLSVRVGRCVVTDIYAYDVHLADAESEKLRDWLESRDEDAIVIGASSGEPSRRISPAVNAFAAIGVNLEEIGYRWRVAFVARVGSPEVSQMILVPAGPSVILRATVTCELYLHKVFLTVHRG